MSKNKSLVRFETAAHNPGFEDIRDVAPNEVWEKRELVHIVDVRSSEEYHGPLGRVPGSKLIALNTLPEELKNLPQDETIVFVCHSGNRSAHASAFALECGYMNIFNMKGGMVLWNALGLEAERS